MTNLEVKTIHRWLKNKRYKQKSEFDFKKRIKYRHLTNDERAYLLSFFKSKTMYPNKLETLELANILNLDENKINFGLGMSVSLDLVFDL